MKLWLTGTASATCTLSPAAVPSSTPFTALVGCLAACSSTLSIADSLTE